MTITLPEEQGRIPQWTMHDRLRKSLNESGLDQQGMADYLGVQRQTVANWLSPRSGPDIDTRGLRLWALRTGVPYEWLTRGEVPPTTP